MSAKRKAIRKEIVDLLRKKRITRVADKVYAAHSSPNWHENLPAIDVYVRSETSEELTQAPRTLKRILQMIIEITAAEATDDKTADLLDDIGGDVERILSADDSLDGTVEDLILRSTEFEFKGDAEQPIFSTRLVYDMLYLAGAPETQADQNVVEFKGADVVWDVASHEDDNPTDKIDMP